MGTSPPRDRHGFPGHECGGSPDINLILQLVVVALLLVGRFDAKGKHFRSHGKYMTAIVVTNAAAIAVVMVPSLVLGLGFIKANSINPGSLITFAHAVMGDVAELLGVYLAWSWRLDQKFIRCFGRKRLMRSTMYLCLASAVTGVSFYVYLYLLA